MPFNFVAAVTVHSNFVAHTMNIKYATVATFVPSIFHEMIGPDAMIFVF